MEAEVRLIDGPLALELARTLKFDPCGRPFHILAIDAPTSSGLIVFGFNGGAMWLGRWFGRGLFRGPVIAFVKAIARAAGCTLAVSKHHPRAWRLLKRAGFRHVPELGEWHLEL